MTYGFRAPPIGINPPGILFDFCLNGCLFKFEFCWFKADGFHVYVLEMPICTNKHLSLDDDKLNLFHNEHGRAIWIARDYTPNDVDGAKRLARLWAVNVLQYMKCGTRFWFPRDNGY